MEVFADTSYWVALLDIRDEMHAQAAAVSEELAEAQIVTSEMVLVEFLNHFSPKGAFLRSAAADFVQGLRTNPDVIVSPQDPQQFENALALYAQVTDKNWSLTDCSSFVLMRTENIGTALTHDRNFAQAGFVALLR